jgi:hypothetical protein
MKPTPDFASHRKRLAAPTYIAYLTTIRARRAFSPFQFAK